MRKKRDHSYRTAWPPERVTGLVALWDSGLTSYQVAAALGITRSACMGKLWRLGRLGRSRSVFTAIPERRKVDGLDLLDLTHHHCRWPSGSYPPYSFCGKPVLVGWGVYCKEHASIAYRHSARAA